MATSPNGRDSRQAVDVDEVARQTDSAMAAFLAAPAQTSQAFVESFQHLQPGDPRLKTSRGTVLQPSVGSQTLDDLAIDPTVGTASSGPTLPPSVVHALVASNANTTHALPTGEIPEEVCPKTLLRPHLLQVAVWTDGFNLPDGGALAPVPVKVSGSQ